MSDGLVFTYGPGGELGKLRAQLAEAQGEALHYRQVSAKLADMLQEQTDEIDRRLTHISRFMNSLIRNAAHVGHASASRMIGFGDIAGFSAWVVDAANNLKSHLLKEHPGTFMGSEEN